MATVKWFGELNSVDRVLLRAAFSTPEGIDVYSLHERYLFSPAQIVVSLEKLRALTWIEIDGLNCKLTELGRQEVLRNRRAIFATNVARLWAKSRFITEVPTQSPTTPYIPKLRTLDLKFFKRR
jgi:hypothetical protein